MRELKQSALGTTVVTLTSLMGNGRTTFHRPLMVEELAAFLRHAPQHGDEVKP